MSCSYIYYKPWADERLVHDRPHSVYAGSGVLAITLDYLQFQERLHDRKDLLAVERAYSGYADYCSLPRD
ncbi:hypothetical protein D3C78_1903950 [compost metagenome]